MKRFTMVFLVGLNLACATTVWGQSVEWVRQLGARAGDFSFGVSADGLGNVYISGFTNRSLGGPSAGLTDAFVSKYDDGGLLWTRQLGTASTDSSRGVSADGRGNVYITGDTNGSLGGPNAGSSDVFVIKYDDAGSLLWTRQLGTTDYDLSFGVSADVLGNVYISGMTYGSLDGSNSGSSDAFVSKYDDTGSLLWTRQLGTASSDGSRGVSADGLGNVYISGSSSGSLGGPNAGRNDAFVSKYDDAGSHLWTRQLGTTEFDLSIGVSADGLGNVYISGYSTGGLGGGPNAGDLDVFRAFVSKYDDAGNLLWTRPIGTTSNDFSGGVSADGLGNVYVSGESHGSMGGPNAGRNDAFVIKYDDAGSLLWARQLGTTVSDISFGVSADGLGNVFISGYTDGSLGGANAGGSDAFVAKLSDLTVPEPSTLAIVATCIIGFAVRKQKTSPSATAGPVAVGWHC